MSRDDKPSIPNGIWARVRGSLAGAWNGLVGGESAADSASNGSDNAARSDSGDETVAVGRGGNGRPTERLMTPEEQVVEIVSANGGGMRQAEIVSAVDWSESTVSRKLSDLEAREVVTRFQIGREKLVYLPGNEPETLDSPFGGADAGRPSRA